MRSRRRSSTRSCGGSAARASPTSRASGDGGDRLRRRDGHPGDHLAKGRPLVVAIDAGRGRLHDVVAVGFDDARGEVIVHDPARGAERRIAAGELERKWAKSGRWTLLVTPKDFSQGPRPEGP